MFIEVSLNQTPAQREVSTEQNAVRCSNDTHSPAEDLKIDEIEDCLTFALIVIEPNNYREGSR